MIAAFLTKTMADPTKKLKRAALEFRAVNHPLRIGILQFIQAKDGAYVNNIVRHLNIEQSVVSSHLKILRAANLVRAKRTGANIYYHLNVEKLLLLHKVAEDLTKNITDYDIIEKEKKG